MDGNGNLSLVSMVYERRKGEKFTGGRKRNAWSPIAERYGDRADAFESVQSSLIFSMISRRKFGGHTTPVLRLLVPLSSAPLPLPD